MSAKKGKSTSKSKGKKDKKNQPKPVTPIDLPPDPVLLAIHARIAGKYRNLEILHRNCERVIHLAKDKLAKRQLKTLRVQPHRKGREADGFFKTFQRELEQEITYDIKPYKIRRKDMHLDVKQQFMIDVNKYIEYLAEVQQALNDQLTETTSVLTEEFDRLHAMKEALAAQLAGLSGLQAVKDDQAEMIRRLRMELNNIREDQAEEAQRIRLRHARHRLLDLEGCKHRMRTVSEHLAKETLPYFVYRLEAKIEENRKLRSTISKRVNDVKQLQKCRGEMEARERALTFEYQHLLKYKKDTGQIAKALPPITGFRTIKAAHFGSDGSNVHDSLAAWNWHRPRTLVSAVSGFKDSLNGKEISQTQQSITFEVAQVEIEQTTQRFITTEHEHTNTFEVMDIDAVDEDGDNINDGFVTGTLIVPSQTGHFIEIVTDTEEEDDGNEVDSMDKHVLHFEPEI